MSPINGLLGYTIHVAINMSCLRHEELPQSPRTLRLSLCAISVICVICE